MSPYREGCTGGYCAGSSIRPLTTEEAKEWLEEYADADTYITVFGDVEE